MHNITSLGQARDYGDRLSKLLKKYRESANFRLTQGDLATRVGVSARSIRDWESGINLPTARNLKKLIEVYHQLGLFTSGKEREEAEELWILRQGKDLSNTFPLFDASWLDSTSDKQEVKKPEVKLDQQPPEQPTATSPEKVEKAFPTNLMSGNLPLQLTSFIGREKELVEVQQLLSHTRLLTITGTGGAGKTRLSQEIAHSLQVISPTVYREGVWWVDLTPLTDRQQVIQAISAALMLEGRQEGDLYELLANYLQSKKLLVVLDNCEHLIEAVGSLVQKLLKDCPYLYILGTSRESLNISGEQVWPLEGLSVPNLKIDQPQVEVAKTAAAVQLFVERARAAQPLFELNTENTPAVLSICRQLDGLPLAIELAAARVKGLGVEQISRRLLQNFKLLSGGSQSDTPHHQTVQAMINWSYNLLTTEEQLLLRRMAVFRGDFSLEAAEGVLGGDAGPGSEKLDPDDVLILILQLVNKSLMVAVASETYTETRYRLLEIVRQYSQEKLEESLEANQLSYKHLAYYTHFVEDGYPNYFSNQSTKWVAQLDQEYANLRSALSWALASNYTVSENRLVPPGELALRLSSGLGRFWYLKGYISEGEHWLKASLALEGLAERKELKTARARAYYGLGNVLVNQVDQASEYLNISVALYEELNDKFFTAAALNNLGTVYSIKGNYAEAKAILLRSLTMTREIENQYYLGYILSNLGAIEQNLGNSDEAVDYLQKGAAIHRQHNDFYPLGYDLLNLGMISYQKQDLAQAVSKNEEGLQIFREMGHKQGIAYALVDLSVIQRNLQNYDQARLKAEEAVNICKELGDTYSLGYTYATLALIYFDESNLGKARQVARQSLEIRQKNSDKKGILESLQILARLAGASKHWEEYAWLKAAAGAMRQQLGLSQDYMNEQTEFDRLTEEATRHLDPATLDRLMVKGQTDRLEDIVEQVLAI